MKAHYETATTYDSSLLGDLVQGTSFRTAAPILQPDAASGFRPSKIL